MFQLAPDEARLLEILRKDPRFAIGAYEFVRDAVSYASNVFFATGTHVSGRELLEAIRRLATDRFGALAREVFDSWGVRSTEDIGAIVFRLVESGILSKTEEDSPEDFRGVYALDEAFAPETYWSERLGRGRTPATGGPVQS